MDARIVGALACLMLGGTAPPDHGSHVPWSRGAARHLANRAGFGATPAEVDAAAARGRRAELQRLLCGGQAVEPYPVESRASLFRGCADGPLEGLEHCVRVANQEQLRGYALWWIEAMLSGADPLRDRMTLFWHGFFTTSMRTVRDSGMVLAQHAFLRRNALRNYGDLLRGIVHDPAMLVYLDAHLNAAQGGNENFARELLKLYSLGEGNYTEADVCEVARALTGLGFDAEGAPYFDPARHDDGMKRILGRSGAFGPDDVVRILLEQPACARWVAGNLLAYFEGVEPDEGCVEHYAQLLRDHDYEVRPFLAALFTDPAFYAEDCVGARHQSPVDYVVGFVHRCRLSVTPLSLRLSTALLGEELFAPPSVEGWPRGAEWLTTGSLMTRANYAGVLLRTLEVSDIHTLRVPALDHAAGPGVPSSALPPTGLRAIGARRERLWAEHQDAVRLPGDDFPARVRAQGASSDAEVAAWILERALAVEPPPDLRAKLAAAVAVADGRASLGYEDARWLEDPRADDVLRDLLHRALATPAAQLH